MANQKLGKAINQKRLDGMGKLHNDMLVMVVSAKLPPQDVYMVLDAVKQQVREAFMKMIEGK